MRFDTQPYRHGDLILNSKHEIRAEIEKVIRSIDFSDILEAARKTKKPNRSGKFGVRRELNKAFEREFLKRGWRGGRGGVLVFEKKDGPPTKVDFLKDRVAVEVAFVHADFLGNDLLKFQMMSFSHLNRIDVGVYVVITRDFTSRYNEADFEGSITYEKVKDYLPEYRSAIQVPIMVYGLVE